MTANRILLEMAVSVSGPIQPGRPFASVLGDTFMDAIERRWPQGLGRTRRGTAGGVGV